jgi:hypothetical protein
MPADHFMDSTEGIGGYPHSGQGMQSGFKVRDLQEMLRAQKLRSGGRANLLNLTTRTSSEGSAGNPSGFNAVRK